MWRKYLVPYLPRSENSPQRPRSNSGWWPGKFALRDWTSARCWSKGAWSWDQIARRVRSPDENYGLRVRLWTDFLERHRRAYSAPNGVMPTLGGFLQAHLTSNVNHRKTRVILRFCVTECLRNITSRYNLPTDCVIGDSPEVKH